VLQSAPLKLRNRSNAIPLRAPYDTLERLASPSPSQTPTPPPAQAFRVTRPHHALCNIGAITNKRATTGVWAALNVDFCKCRGPSGGAFSPGGLCPSKMRAASWTPGARTMRWSAGELFEVPSNVRSGGHMATDRRRSGSPGRVTSAARRWANDRVERRNTPMPHSNRPDHRF
jgi:hypothetical protein